MICLHRAACVCHVAFTPTFIHIESSSAATSFHSHSVGDAGDGYCLPPLGQVSLVYHQISYGVHGPGIEQKENWIATHTAPLQFLKKAVNKDASRVYSLIEHILVIVFIFYGKKEKVIVKPSVQHHLPPIFIVDIKTKPNLPENEFSERPRASHERGPEFCSQHCRNNQNLIMLHSAQRDQSFSLCIFLC